MTERFTHERVFPVNLKKQLACIYTNNFFSGLRITDAVWVALLAARWWVPPRCWASSWR